MSEFDHSARYALRNLDSAGLLRWLLGEKFWSAWRWAGWEDSQAAPGRGERGLRADTVAIFDRQAGDHGPLLVVLEFLAQARQDVLERLVAYSIHFRQNVAYQSEPSVPYEVIGIVVNLKGSLASGAWSMAPPDCDGLGLWQSAGVRNLEEQDARQLLAAIEAGTLSRSVLVFVPLMAGADTEEAVAWWRRLAEQETNERMRADYGGCALIFAEHARRLQVWQNGLEGFNMVQSKVIQEWISTGEARGEARGETIGRLKTLRETLLDVLKARFKQAPPEDLATPIQQQEDSDTLKRWIQLAVTVGSLEEMRSRLANGNGNAG